MKRELRNLTLQLQGADLRTAKFEDRDHLVVPAVILMEGVIQAVNADTPELVLASELAKAPTGWNGRPVVGDHPVVNGERVSANNPKVLEDNAFGLLFNTRMDDKKLKTEAWLDPIKAERTENGAKVLERVKAGEMIEVSVGVFVTAEKISGVHEGKHYQIIWRDIVPDHLAMLSEHVEGACSIDMGCGAPRAAQTCPKGGESTMADKKKSVWDRMSQRVKDLISFRLNQEEDVSDVELRDMLDAALRAIEPGYLGIEAVFAQDGSVVYAVAPTDMLQFFQRSFSVAEDGVVALKDNQVEVRPVTRFEPVSTEKKDAQKKENTMDEKKAERIKALIGNPKNHWVTEDQAYLETLTEERLTSLEAELVIEEPEGDKGNKGDGDGEPDPKLEGDLEPNVELTEEQQIANLPAHLQAEINENRAAKAKVKEDLVNVLKVAAQGTYTECELKDMSLEELEKLRKLVKIARPDVDFSLKGSPRRAEDNTVPAPPSLVDKIKANRAK